MASTPCTSKDGAPASVLPAIHVMRHCATVAQDDVLGVDPLVTYLADRVVFQSIAFDLIRHGQRPTIRVSTNVMDPYFIPSFLPFYLFQRIVYPVVAVSPREADRSALQHGHGHLMAGFCAAQTLVLAHHLNRLGRFRPSCSRRP